MAPSTPPPTILKLITAVLHLVYTYYDFFAAGVHPVMLWSSSLWSSLLLVHCRNIHCITTHGATHVFKSAAPAPISSSAVVQEGCIKD